MSRRTVLVSVGVASAAIAALAGGLVFLRLNGELILHADSGYWMKRQHVARPVSDDEHAKLLKIADTHPESDMTRDIVEPCDLPCADGQKCFFYEYGRYLVCDTPCTSNLDCALDEFCHCRGEYCHIASHHSPLGICSPNPFPSRVLIELPLDPSEGVAM